MRNKYLDIFNAIEGRSDEFLDNNFEMLYHKKLLRDDLLKVFSFAIPDENAIKEIVKYSPLIEIGAGTGYWAYLIKKYGGDIVAFDNDERNQKFEGFYKKQWFRVQFSDMAFNCLKSYTGKFFIYVGELRNRSCANESFFEYLEERFCLIKDVAIPQWARTRDILEVYKRN